jgi:hypothetical protein
VLLRDAQVLPIWEGTTNVLSLDALVRGDPQAGLDALKNRIDVFRRAVREPQLSAFANQSFDAIEKAHRWMSAQRDPAEIQANARRIAMTIGKSYELALLADHAQWQWDESKDRSGIAAASRFAACGIDELYAIDSKHSRFLMYS